MGIRSVISFLVCIVSFFSTLQATTSQSVFAKYPNKYFIETGTWRGDGVRMALNAGFEKVYSIEVSPIIYADCKNLFASQPAVSILLGDSRDVIPQLMKFIDAPATFWLDGHYTCEPYKQGIPSGHGEKNSPILEELDGIAQHFIKTHTILIDDIRYLETVHFDYVTLEEIIRKILEINPAYKITFEDGYIPNDVLVAYIEN
jgi:hypothetical protein